MKRWSKQHRWLIEHLGQVQHELVDDAQLELRNPDGLWH